MKPTIIIFIICLVFRGLWAAAELDVPNMALSTAAVGGLLFLITKKSFLK
ncbi:MAG: hypothetical protein ACRC8Z_10830 [Empedobacter falsenii]